MMELGWCSDDCPKDGDWKPDWKPDETLTITTHFVNVMDIKYTINGEDEPQPVYKDIVRVNSSGPAAKLYPDSLGEYRRLSDITYNDRPVFQHSDREDRFIIQNGNHKIILLRG